MMKRSTLFTLPLLAGVLMFAACGSDDDGGGTQAPPDDNTVDATPSLTFTPATLTISAGETVTFAFGSTQHNVFFDEVAGAPADIPDATANASVDRAFPTAGSFHYECHIHSGMQGTIVVQ